MKRQRKLFMNLLAASLLAFFCVFSIGCLGSNAKIVTPIRPVDSEAAKKERDVALANSKLPAQIIERLQNPGSDNRKRPGR